MEVVNDSAGAKISEPRQNKSKVSCCVPNCNKPGYVAEGGNTVTFHTMPKDDTLLKQWIVKIRRDVGPLFRITKYTKICSRHFKNSDFRITFKGKKFLQPNAVPSVFEWSKSQPRSTYRKNKTIDVSDTTRAESQVAEAVQLPSSSSSPSSSQAPTTATTQEAVNAGEQLQQQIVELQAQLKREKQKAELYMRERDHVRKVCDNMREKQEKVQHESLFRIENFLQSNSDITFYTGFPSANALRQCFRLLNPEDNLIYKDSKGKLKRIKDCKLSYINQFFLTLVRLRLGLMEKDLAVRFQISVTTVHRYFISWVNYMYLKLGSIKMWPSKEDIIRTMPESMKEKFPRLEWIIDACEIQIQRPASLMLQSQSYSNYKSRNTLKGLVACTPSGHIGFISQLYTGNISDRELVIRSGFLDMPHNDGAVWLVDKGFQIDDLAKPMGVKVNMPAFVGSRAQMSESEVFHTQSIASERIHIERAINKIKKFHFFERPIPISTMGTVNQAWCVCALLTMFHKPIISA